MPSSNLARIEKGCLAIVINDVPENNGKVVEVGDYLEEHPIEVIHGNRMGGRLWAVNTPLKWESAEGAVWVTSYEKKAWEHNLLRIDGYSEEVYIASEIQRRRLQDISV